MNSNLTSVFNLEWPFHASSLPHRALSLR